MYSQNFEHNGARYTVYENGEIHGANGKLSTRQNDDGYLTVTLGRKGKRSKVTVHKIVARYLVPNPDPEHLTEIDHLDANRQNPAAYNLEWVSHEENIRRAKEKGNYSGRYVGAKNPKANLTEELVLQLRAEYKAGTTIRQLERKYGYPYNTIGNAVRGITWSHLPL